ncbi:MAG: aminotransferase class III-fold pyridoxal phosphate-dependent enzyme, partial [Deltaproteobacteria bacterium]|nr:aminotransferase class III-fold pyridoxal phosphate-dependent enzyme [Deltaproteobacteria bacterium]
DKGSAGIIERDHAAVASTIYRYTDIAFHRGEGVYLYDLEGREYLDFVSGIATMNVGHCHPKVVEAICEQAHLLIHGACHIGYMEPYIAIMESIKSIAPGDLKNGKGILVNSGSEAVETALKLARFVKNRPLVLAFTDSFHGRSMGALALTSSSTLYRQNLTGLLSGVYHTPYPYCFRCPLKHDSPDRCGVACLNLVEKALETVVPVEDLAAIIVEPIAGEGGYIVPPAGFLSGLREICDRHDIMLIADEIQTGFGRTGKMFAVEHWDIVPDVLCLAKAMGGGLPLGAILGKAEYLDEWPPAAHGTTFGGNPIACRAGSVTLEIIKSENLIQNAKRMGDHLMDQLISLQKELPIIGDVRGRGLMIGAELVNKDGTPANEIIKNVIKQTASQGVVLTKCGASTIRFAPPLIISEVQLEKGLSTIIGILKEYQW